MNVYPPPFRIPDMKPRSTGASELGLWLRQQEAATKFCCMHFENCFEAWYMDLIFAYRMATGKGISLEFQTHINLDRFEVEDFIGKGKDHYGFIGSRKI